MCGFAGEFLFGAGSADLDLSCRMAAKLAHRGPDEGGSFVSADGRCALGFRRLAVIDPAGSHQPMSRSDLGVTVAYNGEIYNFRELRAELKGEGADFLTAGDTEVLLHLYRRDGPEMLGRLRGMFALALYDRGGPGLLLARDRLGQKPLWYSLQADRIVFASEIGALLAHPLVGRDVSPLSLSLYLTMGYIPAPHGVYGSVRKLMPGHLLEVSEVPAAPRRYWEPGGRRCDGRGSRAEMVESVRARVEEAVGSRMISDVPLGALLSGGVDSSVIVALMAARAGQTGGIRTFTAGFEQAGFDERPAAAEVAAHCGTEHTEFLVRPAPGEMLDELVRMYGEPFGDSSALPTWLICKAAREHVTVALAGDGGDEVFGGYDRYRAIALADRMGAPAYLAVRVAAGLLGPFDRQDERTRVSRFRRFADGLLHPFAEQYFRYRRLFSPEDLKRLLTEDFARSVDLNGPAAWFHGLYEEGDWEDEVVRAQRHDLLSYLPDDLLVKTDIASMAVSLELRAPMLDHEVVEAALSLPRELRVGGRHGKVVLREAFGDLLPGGVFERPKRGFGVPLDDWLRGELRYTLVETLLDGSREGAGMFRREALAGLINDHLSRRADHRHRLWALLVLFRWLGMR